MITKKKCTACRETKPADKFRVSPANKDGLYSYCKECAKGKDANRYADNKEKAKEQQAIYRARNKKVLSRAHKAYYAANKERISKRDAAYRKENAGKIAAKNAQWRQLNRDRIKENNKRYNQRYPEKFAAKRAVRDLVIPGYELHHHNYSEAYYRDVIVLPKADHATAHRFISYDQPTRMYRRKDTGELLDTKEKHETYINHCIKNFQYA